MDYCEKYFEYNHSGHIASHKFDEVDTGSINYVPVSCSCTQNYGDICDIHADPKYEHIDPEHFVLLFEIFLLLYLIRYHISSHRSRWSIAPRQIMEITHCINLHDIHEDWQEK